VPSCSQNAHDKAVLGSMRQLRAPWPFPRERSWEFQLAQSVDQSGYL